MCVAFSVYNTSVNLGRRNSIKTRVLQENPSTYFVGYPCHMVHNTATKAAESFEAETGFDVEDLLVDLYILIRVQRGRMNSQTIVNFVMSDIEKLSSMCQPVGSAWSMLFSTLCSNTLGSAS